MADEEEAKQEKPGFGMKSGSDNWFKRVEDYINQSIQRFVAFLFFLIFIGAAAGYIIAIQNGPGILIIIPAAAGLLAYFSRDFALVAFAVFVALLLLL